MQLKITPSTIKWVKYSTIHHCETMGKDHLILGDGSFVIFWNLINGQQKIYKATNKLSGDGVRYAVGHKSYNMFAFAEKCFNPRILLISYPDFIKINVFSDGQKFGYAKLAFSETDYLISLSTYPNYNIIVWNWRTGEKIISTKTDILIEKQLIRVMFVNSILSIAQLSTADAPKVSVWELLVCCKKSILKETKIECPIKNSFAAGAWTTEGSLFIVDNEGHIYIMNAKQELEMVIPSESVGKFKPYIVWFKGGLLLFGPDNNIRYYKKSGQWILERTVECPEPFKRLLTSKDLICVSVTDNIYTFNLTDNTFNVFLIHESGLNDICMIYPMGNRMVSLAHNSELTLWDIESGTYLNMMLLKDKALCLKENPEYPYVGVSFQNGVLSLISVYDPDKLTFMTSFHLTKNPLSSIYFTEIGKMIVVADLTIGQFFIIEGHPGGKMQVLTTVTANKQIADYILVASKTCLRLFAIAVTSQCYLAGNKIIRYCIIQGQTPEYKEYKLEESTALYSNLYATKLSNRDRVFYATPLTTKSIHQIETKRGDDYARIIDTVQTNHQMKKILYHVDAYNTISYAYDGLIFVYLDFLQTEKYILASHHRMDGGIKRAYIDPHGKYVISIDRRNIMICTEIDNVKVLPKQKQHLKELHFSQNYEMLFKHPTIGFMPRGELAGKTWLEMQEINLREKERKTCEKERSDIWKNFVSIRNAVQELLTANIEGPDNEKLNLQVFNIDLALKNEKLQKSKEDCEKMRAYLLAKIIAQDKVTNFIKSFCLSNISVPCKSINAFYENYDVTNYTITTNNYFSSETFLLLSTFREIEKFICTKDIFKPWDPLTKEELETKLFEPPVIRPEEIATNLLQIEEEEDEDVDEEVREQRLKIKKDKQTQNLNAVRGDVAHNYIELEAQNYSQVEVITFFQTELQKILATVESTKLMTYFNKQFESLKSIKEREMFNIKEYNHRLRHIISEINYFSTNKLRVYIDDPEYRQEEQPERILTVEDNEISITPYISPSVQAKLDADAAEAERIRLLLLADDFRERALMAMMNGVLEIRWEDELRKQVSKPKCMLEKEPEEFNEEDLRAVKQYEADIVFLESERERYKILLEAEYGKVAQSVREGIKKFNGRLDELFSLKLKIDSALDQYSLRTHRKRLHYYREIVVSEKEKEYENEIIRIEQDVENHQKNIASLYENLNETRANYDGLMAKEKILEKNLRKDFAETSPVVQDQAQKLYKKRPKVSLRSMLTPSLYFELARAIVTHDRPKILNTECVDFLKSVDNIDLYIGISSTVDENNYSLLCKHRRLRIENELKMKGLFADITEGENTIAILQKIVTELKEKQIEVTNNLSLLRTEKLLSFKDIEIQMVLRGGLIEVPLTGSILDFNDAILVPRKEVEEINDIIIKAGKKKITAMEDVLRFKRGILSKEWEHKRLKMKIVDLKDMLSHINSIKVTKEVQAYLKAKMKGEKEEKITFEQEVELVKKSYERIIDEIKIKVKELQIKINTFKKENRILDDKITNVNVDVCEYKLEYDYDLDQNEKEMLKMRMSTLLKRAKLVREIQNNHHEILVLQTELEILRLKTFPTLKYKIFN